MLVERAAVQPTKLEPFSNEVALQRREYGGKSKDTLETSEQNKESWGGCATRWLCFVPNLMWMCVKKVVCVLTGGCYCTDRPSPEEMKKGLEGVREVWKNPDSTPADKEKAWKDFCTKCPGAQEEMVEAYVEVKREAAVGPKGTSDNRREWDDRNREDCRNYAQRRFEDQDITLVDSYLGTFSEVRQQ